MTRRNTVDDVWSRVERDPRTGCLLWTKALQRDGYALWNVEGKCGVLAHRWLYERVRGPIAETLHHKCHRRHCVHPFHLWDMPHRTNCQMKALQRAREELVFFYAGEVVRDSSEYNLAMLAGSLGAARAFDLTGSDEEFYTVDDLRSLV